MSVRMNGTIHSFWAGLSGGGRRFSELRRWGARAPVARPSERSGKLGMANLPRQASRLPAISGGPENERRDGQQLFPI